MPLPMLKILADKAGVSVDKAEEYWNRAKEQAAKNNHKDDYPYIVGIIKKMLGISKESRVVEILDSLASIQKIDITYKDDRGNIKVKTLHGLM
jgi:hypothetical protein